MRTPDYLDSPLSIETIIEDQHRIFANSDSLTSQTYLTIKDESDQEVLIPANMISTIIKLGDHALRSMAKAKENARMLINHPSHYAELDCAYDGNERQLVSKGASYNLELTPVIAWYNEQEKDLTKDENNVKEGWKLYLVGAEQLVLAKVSWDDIEGIRNMAQAAENPNALISMVALLDTSLSKKLASRGLVAKTQKQRGIPNMEIKDLQKIFTASNLLSKNKKGYQAGGLGNLPVKINDKKIKVAIKVKKPGFPALAAETLVLPEELEPSEKFTLEKENMARARIEWDRRFREAISNSGWRIVDLRDPKANGPASYYNTKDCLWLTRIPEDQWEDLHLAAFDAAQKVYGVPVKF